MQNQPVESCIGNEQVTAASEHKERYAFRACPGCSLGDILLGLRGDKPARRTTDAQGRVRRKYLVFFDDHSSKATPPIFGRMM